MKPWIVSCFVLALAAMPALQEATWAQTPPSGRPPVNASARPEPAPSLLPETPDSLGMHQVTIDGRPISYTARVGTLALRDEREQLTARMFYVAYTVEGQANRPVTFVYNGGPGSSSMWLHMGSFGPMRVAAPDGGPGGAPPYRTAENPSSLLDKTDLVFIDMPGSGFGRILGAGRPEMFYGVDQDVAAFAQFVRRYVTRFARWNSPKFLFGESYGTTRSAALADSLLHQGIALNGVVLLSSILNFGLDYGNGDPIAGGDWAYVHYLPTEAATAWYHNAIPNKPADLPTFLARVERFATGNYFAALTLGDRLGASGRLETARQLSAYTGLSERYLLNANLRVSYRRFQQELLRSRGVIVGRLDSRFQTYALDRAAERSPWDPTTSAIDAPFTSAINQYLRVDLNYDTPLEYRANVYAQIRANGASWDETHNRRTPTNVAPDLAEAMTQNPALRVFSANGYYDFATPYFATVYTLKHLNLAAPLQKNISFGFYPAGHMVYLNDAALAQFKADLARWYDAATSR